MSTSERALPGRSRSWLGGTMDAIATARKHTRSPSPAPRPRRATDYTSSSPARPGIPPSRSFPSSPGGGPVNRMRSMSQDSLDLSVHHDLGGASSMDGSQNGGSQHGGSQPGGLPSVQIIQNLRVANAELTDRTADLEAGYLTQIGSVSQQVRSLQERIRQKDGALQSQEALAASAEIAKEEARNAKATVADLRGQLFRLQEEVEDAEYDKQKWAERARGEGEEREGRLRERIERLEAELDEARAAGASGEGGGEGDDPAPAQGGRYVPDSDIKAYEDEIAVLRASEEELRRKLAEAEAANLQTVTELETRLREKEEAVEDNRVQESRKAPVGRELEDVKVQLREARVSLAAVDDEKAALAAEIEAKDSSIDDLKRMNSAYETELSGLRSEVVELKGRLEDTTEPSRKSSGVHDQVKELELAKTAMIDALNLSVKEREGSLVEAKIKIKKLQETVDELKTNSAKPDSNGDELRSKLEDRDTTISALAKASALAEQNLSALRVENAALHEQVKTIKEEVSLLRQKRSPKNGTPTWEELHRLQQEGEIFAAQIIEQDQEIETLRRELEDEKKRSRCLSKESTSPVLVGDEVKESEVCQQLNRDIKALKEQLSNQERGANKLRNQVDDLKLELERKSEMVTRLEKDRSELKSGLEEQAILVSKERRNAVHELEEQINIVTSDKNALVGKVNELEKELNTLEKDSSNIRDLRKRLKIAERDNAKVEENAEKKLTLLQAEKDAEIDILRKELTSTRQNFLNEEQKRTVLEKKLDSTGMELQEELQDRLHQKNSKIYALEQTLEAQDQVLGSMQAEMDQLQAGMDKVSLTRRAEIEEMEQELMETAQSAANYEREIVGLKDRLDETKLRHSTEVTRLQETIQQLEQEPVSDRISGIHDDSEIEELNEKIDQLRWRVSDLQDENEKLRGKLEEREQSGRAKRGTDRYRQAALQERVHELKKKNQDLEKELIVTSVSTLSVGAVSSLENETQASSSSKSKSRSKSTGRAGSRFGISIKPPSSSMSKSNRKFGSSRKSKSSRGTEEYSTKTEATF